MWAHACVLVVFLNIEMKVGCSCVKFLWMLSKPVLYCPKQELGLCNLDKRIQIWTRTLSLTRHPISPLAVGVYMSPPCCHTDTGNCQTFHLTSPGLLTPLLSSFHHRSEIIDDMVNIEHHFIFFKDLVVIDFPGQLCWWTGSSAVASHIHQISNIVTRNGNWKLFFAFLRCNVVSVTLV